MQINTPRTLPIIRSRRMTVQNTVNVTVSCRLNEREIHILFMSTLIIDDKRCLAIMLSLVKVKTTQYAVPFISEVFHVFMTVVALNDSGTFTGR